MTIKNLVKASHQPFGQLKDSREATLYTLRHENGTQVDITNFGGIIVNLFVADKNGNSDDIVLGYNTITEYEEDTYYLGAVIGRYAGRIDQGKLLVNDQEYQLNLNTPNSQLHGGKNALNKQLWHGELVQTEDSCKVVLNYTSNDGEEGFPGTVDFKVIYSLNNDAEFSIEYFANTDKTTPINLTQHSYFNLAGQSHGNILEHQVMLNADYFLPMDERIYPTGKLKPVVGSFHDFRKLATIGTHIDSDEEQIVIGKGFDNYWLFKPEVYQSGALAAQAVEPNSGRRMSVYTDQPCVILYTANYIDGTHIGKENTQYQARAALCIETQQAFSEQELTPLKVPLVTPEKPFYSKTTFIFDTL